MYLFLNYRRKEEKWMHSSLNYRRNKEFTPQIDETKKIKCIHSSTIEGTKKIECIYSSTIKGTKKIKCNHSSTIEGTKKIELTCSSILEGTRNDECTSSSTIEGTKKNNAFDPQLVPMNWHGYWLLLFWQLNPKFCEKNFLNLIELQFYKVKKLFTKTKAVICYLFKVTFKSFEYKKKCSPWKTSLLLAICFMRCA